MSGKIKIAGIQMHPVADRGKNLLKASSLIELASGEGAVIAALPQLFNVEWFPHAIDAANFELAEAEDGPTITSVRAAAAKNNIAIVAPIFESFDGAYYNTAFVIGEDGEIIGKYRKVHVPQLPLWEERTYFAPGDTGFPVFKTKSAVIGVQICWDVFFPEGFRILALKGAQVVFAPTASAFVDSHKKWERAICAAAHANGLFVMRVNRVGREAMQEFYGRSFCAGPDGEFAHKPIGASAGIVVTSVDLVEVSSTRNEWVFLKDRRPDAYGELLEKK